MDYSAATNLKVNVGCGSRVMDGWVNCDIAHNPDAPRKPEILCDARVIPLPDGCASTLQAIHIFEHFYRWEADEAIAEWRRVLARGGLLILEMPDFMKMCRNVVEGRQKGGKHPDQLTMWAAYGDPRDRNPFMTHRWGWWPESLSALLAENGFGEMTEGETQYHRAGRLHRDFRMTARKQ